MVVSAVATVVVSAAAVVVVSTAAVVVGSLYSEYAGSASSAGVFPVSPGSALIDTVFFNPNDSTLLLVYCDLTSTSYVPVASLFS